MGHFQGSLYCNMDELHAAISIVERRAVGNTAPRSPPNKKLRHGSTANVGNVHAAEHPPPAHEQQHLMQMYNNSLAQAKAARKLLEKGGWIANWSPEGKGAWFLYAYEIAMVGKGCADGCMARIWGGEAVRLSMHHKVLAIKLRQIFGKRNLKAKHAHVVTLARKCLIHCDTGQHPGRGALLRGGLVGATTGTVACGSVVCFSCGSSRRHLEAKVCAITMHSSYDPSTPGCDSAEKTYVDMWKARFGGANCADTVDSLCVPMVTKRTDVDLTTVSAAVSCTAQRGRVIQPAAARELAPKQAPPPGKKKK